MSDPVPEAPEARRADDADTGEGARRDPLSMLFQPGGLRLERRLATRPIHELYATVIALAITAVIIGGLVALVGVSPQSAFSALYEGAFGNRESALETLVQATPLILTGLAAAVAFRAGVWNIGGEGQFFAGAMGAYWMSTVLDVLPAPLLFVGMFLGGAIAGALWSSIASVLLVRYGTNEILTTVMLNFVILYGLSWLLSGPWQSPKTPYYQTERMADRTWLPRFFHDSRLHWGFGVALVMAVVVHFVVKRTSLGFELRAIGVNKQAAGYKGIHVGATAVAVMAISGALAGMSGAGELLGLHHRLQLDIAEGVGFTGIIVALVARLHPAGVIVAAIAFAGLFNGSTAMQVGTGIPAALVQVIEGVALVLVLLAAVACRYRLKKPAHHHE